MIEIEMTDGEIEMIAIEGKENSRTGKELGEACLPAGWLQLGYPRDPTCVAGYLAPSQESQVSPTFAHTPFGHQMLHRYQGPVPYFLDTRLCNPN